MDICGLVSIIIPIYNVAAYIEESLESVIYQTYCNLEILLVDDGSTDGSGKMCDEYEKRDSRIRVVHQDNRGLSAARNTGLNMMSGDAVAFLDSDDALMPDYIEKMVATMVKENADLVLCKYLTYRTTGRMIGESIDKERPLIPGGIYDHISSLQAMVDGKFNHSAWNKLYSRKLWDSIRYPEGQVYEDIATTFKIVSRCDKICVLDDPLYRYRKRPGSILETHSSKNVNDWLSSCSLFEAFVEHNIPDVFS
jgi:glycosyltransferase involved in cell wall biosynthesis